MKTTKIDRTKLDISKLAHLKTGEQLLTERHGEQGTQTRKEFDLRAKVWYFLEILEDTNTTPEEKNHAQTQLKALEENHPQGFKTALMQLEQEKKEETIREKLQEISPFISFAYISRNYFKKSRAWFVQRLNGNIVNGKPAQFTETELQTLNHALHDISNKISSITI